MAVKIRLKRLGKLKTPHYRIVVADSRTKRDGRVIEEIGRYVPTTEPSIIEVDSERAIYWLGVGAQPTEQVAALLKITGDFQKSKGDASAKNTVKPQVAKEAFVADTKKAPVLKPREEIVVKKEADKVAEEVVEAVVEAAAVEEAVEEIVEAAAEVVAEEAVAEVEPQIMGQHIAEPFQRRFVETEGPADVGDDRWIESGGTPVRSRRGEIRSSAFDPRGNVAFALELRDRLFDRPTRRELHDREVDGDDPEQGRDGEQQTTDDVSAHAGSATSGGVVRGGFRGIEPTTVEIHALADRFVRHAEAVPPRDIVLRPLPIRNEIPIPEQHAVERFCRDAQFVAILGDHDLFDQRVHGWMRRVCSCRPWACRACAKLWPCPIKSLVCCAACAVASEPSAINKAFLRGSGSLSAIH